MKELKGEHKGFQYDISFVGDAQRTVCVFAVRAGADIVDIRSEVFLKLPLGAAGEQVIRQRVHEHIDQLA